MRPTISLAALATGLLVAGCATLQPTDRAQVVIATASPPAEFGTPAPRQIPLDQLTYSALDDAQEPLILASLDDGDRVMTLTPTATDEETVTWVSPEGASFRFRGAQLVATERLADDLMSVEQDTAAMQPNEPAYRRDYHHQNGGGLRVTRVACTMADPVAEEIEILDMAYQTLRLDETCTGAGDSAIQNAYWVGGDGTLWQSRQWVSAEAGFLEMKRLVR